MMTPMDSETSNAFDSVARVVMDLDHEQIGHKLTDAVADFKKQPLIHKTLVENPERASVLSPICASLITNLN